MYRNLLFILVIFLSACTAPKTAVVYPSYKEQKSNDFDLRVMKAYNYQYFNDNQKAKDEFLTLFKDYNNTQFLENAYILTLANNLNGAKQLDILAQPYLNQNDNLKRLSALYALYNNDTTRAQKLIEELLAKKDKDIRNYELYGDILVRKNEFSKAVKYYTLAYEQSQNEDILLKLIGSYAVLNNNVKIKDLLETFRKNNGCTLKTCMLLVKIYNDEKKYNALKQVYLDLYSLTKNENFLLAAIEVANMQGETKEALNMALKYNANDKVKLYLYESLKQFDKAKELSLQKYEESKDKKFLLSAAVFEFEEATLTKKITPKLIDSVRAKFAKAIDENSDALYLNYYGYLLIDHNLDIKKGMKLIERALEKEPNNFYYIDSLAWGYYKLGECQKAWGILQKTFGDKKFLNSQETKEHIKAIKECLKE